MKVLLIQPPIRDFYRTKFREYPLGLLYLAAALIGNGIDAKILDARTCRRPLAAPVPESLKAAADFFARVENLFGRFSHFGMTYDEIGAAVAERSPDVVCISSMFTPYANEVKDTARAIEAAYPRARIIVGGCHATADPASLAECESIDHIVMGEGEEILPEIIGNGTDRRILSGSDGSPLRISNLDSLPVPARELIDLSKYMYGKRPYAMVLTSRGCPHRCTFCSTHTVAGHVHRKRNIGAVLDEIDVCINKFGIRNIDFQDDNLLFDRDRIARLLEEIIVRFENCGIEFMASNGLNVAHLDEELLRLMRRCGFRKLDIAIATGNVGSRAGLMRPEGIPHYEKIVSLARGLDLKATTYIILGIPTQPIREMIDTVEHLKGMDTLIAPSIFYNVPGMPIFDEMKRYEYCDDHAARRSTAMNCFGDDFSRNDIFKLFSEIREYNLKRTSCPPSQIRPAS